jgi:hypothetical protein
MMNTSAQTSVKTPVQFVADTAKQAMDIIDFNVNITSEKNGQKFILLINNPLEEKLRISIASPEGVGFTDNTKTMHYRKRINLTDAQDGQYTVTVSSNKKTYSKTLALQTATIQTRTLQVNE